MGISERVASRLEWYKQKDRDHEAVVTERDEAIRERDAANELLEEARQELAKVQAVLDADDPKDGEPLDPPAKPRTGRK